MRTSLLSAQKCRQLLAVPRPLLSSAQSGSAEGAAKENLQGELEIMGGILKPYRDQASLAQPLLVQLPGPTPQPLTKLPGKCCLESMLPQYGGAEAALLLCSVTGRWGT